MTSIKTFPIETVLSLVTSIALTDAPVGPDHDLVRFITGRTETDLPSTGDRHRAVRAVFEQHPSLRDLPPLPVNLLEVNNWVASAKQKFGRSIEIRSTMESANG